MVMLIFVWIRNRRMSFYESWTFSNKHIYHFAYTSFRDVNRFCAIMVILQHFLFAEILYKTQYSSWKQPHYKPINWHSVTCKRPWTLFALYIEASLEAEIGNIAMASSIFKTLQTTLPQVVWAESNFPTEQCQSWIPHILPNWFFHGKRWKWHGTGELCITDYNVLLFLDYIIS